MDRPISVFGWVLIIFTALFIISLFISLFSRLKEKGAEPKWIDSMKKAGSTIRDPFAEENRKMQELSEKVASIKKTSPSNKHQSNGSVEAGEEE